MRAERLADHPFPGVELEQDLDRPLAEVGEHPAAGVPADILDTEELGLEPGLDGRVAEVRDRHHVLESSAGAAKQPALPAREGPGPRPRSAARGCC